MVVKYGPTYQRQDTDAGQRRAGVVPVLRRDFQRRAFRSRLRAGSGCGMPPAAGAGRQAGPARLTRLAAAPGFPANG